jgi:predicted nuclease with TOPRIM domain
LEPVHVFLITTFLSIPILAILAGIWKEWLTFRGKRATPAKAKELEQKLERLMDRAGLQLKTLEKANQELEEKLKRLEITNEEYAERLENLEAVVVSQAWDALHKPKLRPKVSEPDGEDAVLPTRPHEVSEPTVEERNRQRAADLARRLG